MLFVFFSGTKKFGFWARHVHIYVCMSRLYRLYIVNDQTRHFLRTIFWLWAECNYYYSANALQYAVRIFSRVEPREQLFQKADVT